MRWLHRFVGRRQIERDLTEEIRTHLDERVDELIQEGLARDDAERRARREFGNVARIEEEGRDVWRWRWIEDLFADVRFAVRQLGRAPAFAAAGALTLALGTGANTAVFSVVDTVVLRPLPFPESDRLVALRPRSDERTGDSMSYPNFFDIRAASRSFEQIASYRSATSTVTGLGEPLRLPAAIVSWNLFAALRVPPALGRPFVPDDEEPGTRAAIVSHGLWSTRFGSDPAVVGRTIELDRDLYTIVGVMPRGFRFPIDGEEVHLWLPAGIDARSASAQPLTRQRGARVVTVVARPRAGVSFEAAETEVRAIAASLAEQHPDDNRRYPSVAVDPALDVFVGAARAPLFMLFAAVGLVLLLACANIANLVLSRTAERAREFAIRAAIGAGTSRMIRQVIAESLALSCAGSVLGAAIAYLAVPAAASIAAAAVPRIAGARVDGRVLIFSLAVAVVTAVAFSLAPLVRLRRVQMSHALQASGRTHAAGADRMRAALVVAQIAIGLILVSGAGLFAATYAHLTRRDPGFDAARLLTFRVSLPGAEYRGTRQLDFYARLIEQLGAVPGVESAAAAMPLPATGSGMRIAFDIEERPAPPHLRPTSDMAIVSPEFFATAGIPVLQGRSFAPQDTAGSQPVVIVNRAFADRFFPGERALGKRIRSGATSGTGGAAMREIVGIVGNARQSPLGADAEPIYYLAHGQMSWCCPAVIVRTHGRPEAAEAAVRSVLASIDSRLPMFDVRTGERLIASGIAGPRFVLTLLGSFAVIGLVLTTVGLYGLLNYAVVRQTREIGLRIALGAGRASVLSMVVGKSMLLVSVGLILGLAGSLAAGRLVRNLLHGVGPADPALLTAATAVLLMAASCATYLPARRAASIDPTIALREE